MNRILDFDPTTRVDGPRLQCPILPAIHDGVVRAQAGSVAWSVEMGLTERGCERFAVLEKAQFASLAARCFPRVTAAQMRLAADWITFLFFYDDLCDTLLDAGDARDEAILTALDTRLVEILRRGDGVAPKDAFGLAMADMRRRLLAMAKAGWLSRIADDMELYLQGARWERCLERDGEDLSLSVYRHMRPMISAVNVCFDLAGAFAKPCNPSLGREPIVRELERIANNHISWVNDIFSLDRERSHGRNANLVVALAKAESVPLRRALDRAIVVCNEEMLAFTRLEARLDQLGATEAGAYVAAMASWIRGSFDWHAGSERYVATRALTLRPDTAVAGTPSHAA